jgi:hypothetical protein
MCSQQPGVDTCTTMDMQVPAERFDLLIKNKKARALTLAFCASGLNLL